MIAPILDVDTVKVTAHARSRYWNRRDTHPGGAVPGGSEAGIQRLLERAAKKPTPPLRIIEGHGAHRSMSVGGFMLVFDADMRTLITMWRQK